MSPAVCLVAFAAAGNEWYFDSDNMPGFSFRYAPRAKNGPKNERKPAALWKCTFLGIARRSALLGATRSRLAVNDRRRHCPETTLQRRFIGIGTPHLDYDGGRQTLSQEQATNVNQPEGKPTSKLPALTRRAPRTARGRT
jgi:hypothetical protein